MLDLAGLDELLDRARHILDRHLGIHPVLVIEVDRTYAQPLQRAVDDMADAVGMTGDPAARLALLRVDVEAELGGDHDLVAVRGECLANKLLVGKGPVDLRGVEERDAPIDCAAQ